MGVEHEEWGPIDWSKYSEAEKTAYKWIAAKHLEDAMAPISTCLPATPPDEAPDTRPYNRYVPVTLSPYNTPRKPMSDPFLDRVDYLCEKAREILIAKGQDYTIGKGSQDRLFNFREVAKLSGQTQQQVWAVYFLKHVFAVLSHAKNGTESEPIQSRILDCINYLFLYDWMTQPSQARKDAPLK